MARITTSPGEILQEEFLVPLGMSGRRLAEIIGEPSNRITDLVRGRRGMTVDTAIRLARYFNTTPQFWMNLQANHDLSKAAAEVDVSGIPQREVA